jgi:LPXTG-motif cell wall-anchored protein
MSFKRFLSAVLILLFFSTFYIIPAKVEAAPKSEGTVFGGDKLDVGWAITGAFDYGYAVAGFTTSFGAGGSDAYVIKYDRNGKVQWDKVFGGPYNDYAYSIAQTGDGGLVVAGTKSTHINVTDVYLIKLDSEGEVQWEKTYDISGNDEGYSVQLTSDGGYIIAGQTNGGLKSLLIKTDNRGNISWHKIYGGSFNSAANQVWATTDMGYVAAGWIGVSKDNFLDRDVHLIKVGPTGELEWEKTFGGKSFDEGNSLRQTADGGFIITGYTTSMGSGKHDLYLIKTNSSGEKQWEKAFGGKESDVGTAVRQAEDGGFIITGYTNSYGKGSYDVYVVKTDSSGIKLWEETFGDVNDDRGRDLLQLCNGDIVIAGQTKSFGNGTDFDVYTLKLERSSVEVKANYFIRSKKIDIKSTAFHIDNGNVTKENVFSAIYDIRDAEGLSVGISGNLTYNAVTQSWEALDIDVSAASSDLYQVEVTYYHKNGTALSGTGKVIAMGALLGISTPYILEGGTLYIYATPFNKDGERDSYVKKLEVEITGIEDRISLNDRERDGDLYLGDGHYAVWQKITGTGEITIDLYLDDEKVDSATLTVISTPELVVLTDIEALYKQFRDTGTGAEEDKDGNKIVDFFDLLERLNKYAAKHRGIVMDLRQEITYANGASDDYRRYTYDYFEDIDRKYVGILIDEYIAGLGKVTGRSIKNIAIIGDDEVVPFYRRVDPINKEKSYIDENQMNGDHGNPTLKDSGRGYIMTDIPYSSYDNTSPGLVVLPRPDMGIGRIFAVNPNALINSINGYEKHIDVSPSAKAAIFNIKNDNVLWEPVVQKTLVPVLKKHFSQGEIGKVPPYKDGTYYQYDGAKVNWVPDDFTRSLAGADLTMLWTHTSHNFIEGTVKGTGIYSWNIDWIKPSPGHVLMSTGCHSGYSISHNSISNNYSMFNTALVNSLIGKSIAYFAPTTYGYGDDKVKAVTLHDLLNQRFLSNLFTVQNVGQAFVAAYNEYQMGWRNMNMGYATYCAYGMAYYGLPTQPVRRVSQFNPLKLSLDSSTENTKTVKSSGNFAGLASSINSFNRELDSSFNASVNISEFEVTTDSDGKKLFEVPDDNGTLLFNPFAPYLPLVTRSFLLPKGAAVKNVLLTDQEKSTYQGAVELMTGIPVNRTLGPETADETVSISDPYPEQLYWWDTSERDGGVLLNLSIVPMEYKSSSKEVILYNKLDFRIEYTEPSATASISTVSVNGGKSVEEGLSSVPVNISISSSAAQNVILSWKVKDYAGLAMGFGQQEIQLGAGTNDISFNTNDIQWNLGGKDLTVWISKNSDTVAAKNVEFEVVKSIPISTLLDSISVSQGNLVQNPYNSKYYSVDLDNSVTSVDLTAVMADSRATMTFNGKQQPSGQPASISLNPGSNYVYIRVYGKDESEYTEYIVNLYREYSDNARLSNLTVTQGTLVPGFDPETTAYTVNVSTDVTSIGIRPTAAVEGAEIRVNGALVNSGSLRTVPLSLGTNNIRIEVRAPYGNRKIYNITVIRAVITDNARLKSLDITFHGSQKYNLAPDFDPEITLYTAIGYRNDSPNFIIAETEDFEATVTINGEIAEKPVARYFIEPEPGWNEYEVVVTARDGITRKTYKIRFHAAHEGESKPDIAYDPVNDRYFNVYSKYEGESKDSIFGRFIDIYGNPVGDEILISNSHVSDTPRVVYGNGKFLVAWGEVSIRGRFINSDGSYGSEILVLIPRIDFAGTPYYEQYSDPEIAYDSANDRFLIVCSSLKYNGFLNLNTWGIVGMIFNPDGTKYSSEPFVISTPISGTYFDNPRMKYSPVAAYDSTLSRYLVAWTDRRNFTNTFPGDIYGQFVNADGTLHNNSPNANFIISGGRGDALGEWVQDIVYDSNNNRFLVIWKDDDGPNYKKVNIAGRIINGDGTFLGAKFNIANIPRNKDARVSYVFSLSYSKVNSVFDSKNNRYFVTWDEDRDEIDYNIFGRFIDADGRASGDGFSITDTAHDEINPSAAYNLKYGCIIIAYEAHCEAVPNSTQFKRIGCPAEPEPTPGPTPTPVPVTPEPTPDIPDPTPTPTLEPTPTPAVPTPVTPTPSPDMPEPTPTPDIPEPTPTPVLPEPTTSPDAPTPTPGIPTPTPNIPEPTSAPPESTPGAPQPTPIGKIPQTGSRVDGGLLFGLGSVLIAAGVILLRWKRKKEII